MFDEVMPFEVALQEINEQLDKKKIYPKKRQEMAGIAETIAEAMQYGQVVIGENSITQTLLCPIKDHTGAIVIDKLEFKGRISPEVMASKYRAAKASSSEDRLIAAICAYTGEVKGIIDKLDTQDRNTCESLGFFSLV